MPDWNAIIRARAASSSLQLPDDVVDEMAQHAEALFQRARADGASEGTAAAAVDDELRDLSTLSGAARSARAARQRRMPVVEPPRPGRLHTIRAFARDLVYGARLLTARPGFTAVAVLTLALGIGANTAIFQLIDAVRLRTLPVRAPDELAEVRPADMKGARGGFARSYPTVTNPIWEQIRDRQEGFSGIFAWGADTANLAPGGEERPARFFLDQCYRRNLWIKSPIDE